MTLLSRDMLRCLAVGGCALKENCARYIQVDVDAEYMDRCCNTLEDGAFILNEAGDWTNVSKHQWRWQYATKKPNL